MQIKTNGLQLNEEVISRLSSFIDTTEQVRRIMQDMLQKQLKKLTMEVKMEVKKHVLKIDRRIRESKKTIIHVTHETAYNRNTNIQQLGK